MFFLVEGFKNVKNFSTIQGVFNALRNILEYDLAHKKNQIRYVSGNATFSPSYFALFTN